MELFIVFKQACNATEGLPQNTVLCFTLQYIVISYLEQYFSAYRHSDTLYKIVQNFKFMFMQKDLDLIRSGSVNSFKNASLFPGYFCYKIQCDIQRSSFLFSHIQTKLYPKLTIYFKTQSDISMEVSQKS